MLQNQLVLAYSHSVAVYMTQTAALTEGNPALPTIGLTSIHHNSSQAISESLQTPISSQPALLNSLSCYLFGLHAKSFVGTSGRGCV